MSYKLSDVVYEADNHKAWVLTNKNHGHYAVFVAGLTHSVLDTAYPLTEDGLSIAIARVNYMASRSKQTGGRLF